MSCQEEVKTYQELKTYKHSPETRRAMAELQREYRERKKQREAARLQAHSFSMPQ